MPSSSRFAIAIHTLVILAMHGGSPVKSEFIAGSVNTNAVVIRRLLRSLSRAGLVGTLNGPRGGAYLARDPATISLRDIHEAVVEGEAFALHPKGPNCSCPVGRDITSVLMKIQSRVDAAVGNELRGVTLAQVVGDLKSTPHNET
jgi:Rrf2 family protein